MSRAGEELAELLWDASGPALRTTNFPPAPFQPFTCSAAGSTRAHELPHAKSHHAAAAMDVLPIHDDAADDDAVPWLHCPVIDDGDSDTAPLPPEYCAGLHLHAAGYHQAAAASVPDPAPPPFSDAAAVAAPPQETTQPLPGEGVMNFTFFSRPLQRPAPTAAPSSNPLESTVVQTAASRLRSTPLFSEQRMAWLQPPPPSTKAPPRSTAVATPPAPHATPAPATTDNHPHFAAAAAVTEQQHIRFLQPYPADARRAPPPPPPPPDAAAVTTSSVCSGNGDRSQSHQARTSSHHQYQQPAAECSVSQDEDMDDEPSGAARVRSSAARGTKRSRTAEVHNLSERRRRDRINEKMRALQELIPNCNKVDKASMLEEAIEYLKTLQLQVQMMSMGTGLCMPHMLMHPFSPHLGFGMGFDMLPRFAAAQFPHHMVPAAPPMAMFPGGQVMPSPAAFAAYMNAAAAPPEHREPAVTAPPPGGEAVSAADQPPVTAAPQGDPKQT